VGVKRMRLVLVEVQRQVQVIDESFLKKPRFMIFNPHHASMVVEPSGQDLLPVSECESLA